MSELKTLDFAIIIRNMVDVGKPNWENREAILEKLKKITVVENEIFVAMNTVYNAVCSLSKKQMVRFELPEIEILDIPKAHFFSDKKVIEKFASSDTQKIQIHPSLHRSGVLSCNFHLRVEKECSVEETIRFMRTNLRTLIIKLPKEFHNYVKHIRFDDRHLRIVKSENDVFAVSSLKDLTSNIIRPILRHLCGDILQSEVSLFRCVSSTLIQIYKTNINHADIEDVVGPGKYANELLGIATMHKTYQESNTAVESFRDNLSSDEELAMFTFGLSDLIIFDNSFDSVIEDVQARKNFTDPYSAVLYITMHYNVLLEWLYLEKFIIDRYNRLLSRAIANEKTSPSQMLELQKQSMQDLITYTAGITPFPSREEFLEKIRIAHRVPELQEKLEKKRDLATDYVIQEYTLRTNKAIQLVNIFVSATAAFGLMEVVLSISQGNDKAFWGGITFALFVGVLVFLSASSKIISSSKNRR